ncbi:hypothetical protein KCP76_06940 [Salmonella enterica subsp. enterica serovar Weltevreden]|nr:hypothetical protein KCP76_06940 [Salmonella enterica subsp. enterica serovar Weltevreden]
MPAGASRRRAAGGDCRVGLTARRTHAIKEALAAGAAVGAGTDGEPGGDMGYTPGCWRAVLKWRLVPVSRRWSSLWAWGAMTDFWPAATNPRTLPLGAAAQFGIFATVLGR